MAVVASLTLITGVAVAPASQAAKIKLCLALDTGGVDDHWLQVPTERPLYNLGNLNMSLQAFFP